MIANSTRLILPVLCLIFGFYGQRAMTQQSEEKEMPKMKLTSPAFEHEGMIPAKYTCDGENISPPLKWEGAPDKAKSLVLIADDPDAPVGIWVHWVLYDLPPKLTELPEKIPPKKVLKKGGTHGLNDFKKLGYGGPAPPSGTHRYYFKLYALDIKLDLQSGLTKKKLLEAMKGHVLAEGKLMGKYQRIR